MKKRKYLRRSEALRLTRKYLDVQKLQALSPEEQAAFRAGRIHGIISAAEFAGQWDEHIRATPYKLEDLILGKFNIGGLLRKKAGALWIEHFMKCKKCQRSRRVAPWPPDDMCKEGQKRLKDACIKP